MASHLPPIPKGNRSPAGPGPSARVADADRNHPDTSVKPDKKGQSANTKINLTPHLSVQDR